MIIPAEEVSLYIHIPFCISKCSYCDFFSRPYPQNELTNILNDYIEALCNEILFRLTHFKVKKINTVYIGGGTPSLLSEQQFCRLFNVINSSSLLSSSAEITVEVNPDDLTPELLSVFDQCGINRISCGIQTINDAALKKACRRADYKTNSRALSFFQNYWKKDLSIDLISGLPEDDEKTFFHTLEQICTVNPSHISLYSLTIEDNTPFGRQLASGQLIYDFDKADKLWLKGRDYLEEHGYKWYEVSNFCKTGKECLHNLAYWAHKNYLGCGSGACGTVYAADGKGFRWTGTNDIQKYIDFWKAPVKKDAELAQNSENIDLETSEFEFFMMGLRKLSGISEAEFEQVFGKKLPQRFLLLFKEWEKKGLCVRHFVDGDGACRYAMSRSGMLFLNRFLGELC